MPSGSGGAISEREKRVELGAVLVVPAEGDVRGDPWV